MFFYHIRDFRHQRQVVENSSPTNYRKKHPSSSLLEVRWSPRVSQERHSFSFSSDKHLLVQITSKPRLLQPRKTRHFSVRWRIQKTKTKTNSNSFRKGPNFHDSWPKMSLLSPTPPTSYTHLSSSSAFGFIYLHPHETFLFFPFFFLFLKFVFASSSTPEQNPLRNKVIWLTWNCFPLPSVCLGWVIFCLWVVVLDFFPLFLFSYFSFYVYLVTQKCHPDIFWSPGMAAGQVQIYPIVYIHTIHIFPYQGTLHWQEPHPSSTNYELHLKGEHRKLHLAPLTPSPTTFYCSF